MRSTSSGPNAPLESVAYSPTRYVCRAAGAGSGAAASNGAMNLPLQQDIESYHKLIGRFQAMVTRVSTEFFLAETLPTIIYLNSIDMCPPIKRTSQVHAHYQCMLHVDWCMAPLVHALHAWCVCTMYASVCFGESIQKHTMHALEQAYTPTHDDHVCVPCLHVPCVGWSMGCMCRFSKRAVWRAPTP